MPIGSVSSQTLRYQYLLSHVLFGLINLNKLDNMDGSLVTTIELQNQITNREIASSNFWEGEHFENMDNIGNSENIFQDLRM